MNITQILFWFLSVVAIFSALMVITSKNPVYSVLWLVLVAALKDTDIKQQQALVNEGNIGLIKNLGKELFTKYVVPFEISSILFLSAMVGAVVIGKKE